MKLYLVLRLQLLKLLHAPPELKGQETEISKSRKAFRAFEDAAQKFKLNQEEIAAAKKLDEEDEF